MAVTLASHARRGVAALLLLGVVGAASPPVAGAYPAGGEDAAAPPARVAAPAVPAFEHVVVLVMENHSERQIIGNRRAPYLNALAKQGALFTRSSAVTHPSQPNYVALFSGSTQGLTDDSCPHTFSGDNLGHQLIASRRTFAGFSDGLPRTGSRVCSSGRYARKHNPWSDFSDLARSTNRTFAQFPRAYRRLPTVSFVIPDLCHDIHDCGVATGDRWIKDQLGDYVTWAQAHHSLLVVTFDEDDRDTATNRIPTIFVGQDVDPGTYRERITHYSVLRTLETAYGLGALGAAASARPITDVWADPVS